MDVNQRRERIKKWATIGLICAAGFVVAPIVYTVVQGLVGLALAGATGLAIVTFAPWVSMKFANWKVAAIVHEAKENPIETLTNLLMAKEQAYKVFQQQVIKATAARNTFEDKCREFSKQYPHRANEFKQRLSNMSELVRQKMDALDEAKTSLRLGHEKLEEMRAYWEMIQAAEAANEAAQMDIGDQYARLKADTAVDSVLHSMNQAFAQLEVTASVAETQHIEYAPGEVIEGMVIKTKEKVA